MKTNQQIIAHRALALVELAKEMGFVLTIETEALKPLALGNYDIIVTVRESHESYRSAK